MCLRRTQCWKLPLLGNTRLTYVSPKAVQWAKGTHSLCGTYTKGTVSKPALLKLLPSSVESKHLPGEVGWGLAAG